MEKTIFFITPIGDEGTDARKNADAILKVLERTVKADTELSGYNVIRADKIEKTGRITLQIYEYLRDSDVCVVDLTGLNPNVLYELGIRQAQLKPFVLVAAAAQKNNLPFDLYDARTIFYDVADISWALDLEDKLKNLLLDAIKGNIDAFDKIFFERENCDTLTTTNEDFGKRLIGTLEDIIHTERITYGKIENLITSLYKGSGTYLFIDGENQAFSALTAALARAKNTIRTTRYSPFDVGSRQPEFAKMIQNRIKGDNGYEPVIHFYRIMSANTMSKLEKDIYNYIDNFISERFTLYLTPFCNAFELVIIDESEVFIHFHDADKIIGSTLYINNEQVAKKFITIYSSLHDPDSYPGVKRYDFKYISDSTVSDTRREIKEYFRKYCEKLGSINTTD